MKGTDMGDSITGGDETVARCDVVVPEDKGTLDYAKRRAEAIGKAQEQMADLCRKAGLSNEAKYHSSLAERAAKTAALIGETANNANR